MLKTLQCHECHVTFTREVSKAQRSTRYCSDECRREVRFRYDRARAPKEAERRKAEHPRARRTFKASCSRCSEEFEYVYVQRPRTVCDLCRKHDNAWSMYRLSGREVEALRARTACDICGSTESRDQWGGALHIDHDHRTGVVRGVLCSNCNRSIGQLGDTVEALERAVAYLRRAQQQPRRTA